MKRVSNILVFIIAFFLGMLVCVMLFRFQEKKSDEKLALNILKEQNNDLSFKAWKFLEIFREDGIDSTEKRFLLLKKMGTISNYFNAVLSSKKEYNSFSLDTIKSILNINDRFSYVYLGDFYEKAEKISVQNNTHIENEWYINLCFNIILNRCFEEYREISLIMGHGKGVAVPKKDTVKIGDFYEAEIYFAVKDMTLKYKLVDTADFQKIIFEGDVYREKATTKGLNTRKGLLPFFNGEETFYFPVEFSFYVK